MFLRFPVDSGQLPPFPDWIPGKGVADVPHRARAGVAVNNVLGGSMVRPAPPARAVTATLFVRVGGSVISAGVRPPSRFGSSADWREQDVAQTHNAVARDAIPLVFAIKRCAA